MDQPSSGIGLNAAIHRSLGCAMVLLIIGLVFALLLPAVRTGRPGVRMRCSNNLKHIVLALHEYHDDFGTLPPAFTIDENGKRLHSWRTLLLPYLEQQQELYERIRLDEPWNSVHNKEFADLPLSIFHCPQSKSGLSYLAISCDGAIFDGVIPCSFMEIRDGTSNTIAIIEVPTLSCSWMEPVDFDQRQLNGVLASQLSSTHPGGTQVALADGSVRFLPSTIRKQFFQAWLTRNGGEEVREEDWWDPE